MLPINLHATYKGKISPSFNVACKALLIRIERRTDDTFNQAIVQRIRYLYRLPAASREAYFGNTAGMREASIWCKLVYRYSYLLASACI